MIGSVAVHAGFEQGRDAVAICSLRVRSGTQEEFDKRGIVPMRGPEERRGTICESGVHVSVLIEQGVSGDGILALDGVGKRIGGLGRRGKQCDKRRQECALHAKYPLGSRCCPRPVPAARQRG